LLYSIAQFFWFLLLILSSCAIYYWKQDTNISIYYYWIVYFSLQFCQILLYYIMGHIFRCMYIHAIMFSWLTGFFLLKLIHLISNSHFGLKYISSNNSKALQLSYGYYLQDAFLILLTYFICLVWIWHIFQRPRCWRLSCQLGHYQEKGLWEV
jgi:hypothetical protein